MTKAIQTSPGRRLHGWTGVLAGAVLALAPLAAAQAEGNVVSLQDKAPTAEEIVRGFTGGDAPSDLPPGLLPAGAGNGTVKTRGIRMMDATASQPARQPAAQDAAPAHTPERYASTAPPAQPATADCGSGRAIAVSIEFELDSYALRGDAYATLKEVAAAMNSDALAACSFAVEGHTDGQGEDGYNLHLSERRAMSVRDFLTALDVAPGRLNAVGLGERDLLVANDPASPRNRRVQFRIGQ